MRRRWLLGLFLIVLVGIGAAGLGEEVKNPDMIVVASIGQVTSLDPSYSAGDVNSGQVFFTVYENLIRYKRESLSELEPMLSTIVPSYSNGLITDGSDGSVYITFAIREGVKFHEGGELTPEDVKYSFLRKMVMERSGGDAGDILLPLTGYSSLDQMAEDLEPGVESFENASDSTVQKMFDIVDASIWVKDNNVTFHLVDAYPAIFLASIAAGNMGLGCILDKSWVIEQGGWPGDWSSWKSYHDPNEEDAPLYNTTNGTGAFRLKSWDRSTQGFVLERFEDYWREPAKIKTVVYDYVEEWSTRRLMLQNGDADFVMVDSQYIDQVKSMDGVAVESGPMMYTRAFFFQWPVNGTKFTGSGKLDGEGIPPTFFSDIDLRKAFCYAFPYEEYLEQVMQGRGRQPYGPIPIGLPGWRDDEYHYSYDREKAVEYFRAAWDGEVWKKGFSFSAIYNVGNLIVKSALEMLREELLQINPKFKMEVHAATWTEFTPYKIGGNMPLFYSGWKMFYPDSSTFLKAYSQSFGYYAQWDPGLAELAEKYVDPVLEKALKSDPVEREKLYSQLQHHSYEFATHLFFVHQTEFQLYRDWVKGWYHSALIPGINLPGIDFYALYKE